eukprot:TRINITY_DN12583_c0_g1_i1.p1 TRINITY_DN12583_c0_g1~~TRINITY_DN12583_c0_g1_i1.p1  ORF type:complete len:378 (+),score=51.25 TRINITY_DN12583_c0_g1_i1:109-1242(+)
MPRVEDFFSSKYEVKELEGKGKGLVAVEDIEKGELVIRETALELVQGGWETDKLLVLNHLLENVHLRIMKDEAVKRELEGFYPSREQSEKEFDRRELTPDDREKYPEVLIDELNHLYNIITCNTFRVEDVTGSNEVSFAIFLKTSRINHSCDPNCLYYFKDGVIYIRTIKNIPKNTEITIAYCNEYLTRTERRTHLLKNYHFNCDCNRCKAWSGTDIVLDALVCPTDGCEGYVTSDKAGALRCVDCGAPRTPEWKEATLKEVTRKPETTLSHCHPRSSRAFNWYCKTIAAFFSSISKQRPTEAASEQRATALSAAKSAIACLQAAGCCQCEHLFLTLKASVLCPTEGEKKAFQKKAEELCLSVRGDADLKTHFPSWV